MNSIIIAFAVPFSAVIGSVLTMWYKMPKDKIETEAAGLHNLETLISIYKKISEDLNSELKKVQEQCTALRKEVGELRRENYELKKLIEDFRSQTTAKN